MASMTSEDTIFDFLKHAISVLRLATPPDEHEWGKAHFNVYNNGLSAQPTKRPHNLSALIKTQETDEKVFGSIKAHFEDDPLLMNYRKEWSPETYAFSTCGSLNSSYIANMILQDYIERVESLKFDEDLARAVSCGFVSSWLSGFTDVILFDVVKDMAGTFKRVDFGEGIYLERIDYISAVRFRERNQGVPWMRIGTPDGVPPNLYVLCEQIRLRIGEAARTSLIYSHNMQRALTALRLKCADVRELGALCFETVEPGQYCPWVGWSREMPTEHSGMRVYPCVIDYEYISSVATLFTAIKKASSENAIRIALDRIDSGKNRTRPEDTLLDALIALEALFGAGSGEGVSYKIRMRCAYINGSNLQERLILAKDINELHTLRSKVVHGRGRPPADLQFQARRAFELARRSVIKILEMAENDMNSITDAQIDSLLLS